MRHFSKPGIENSSTRHFFKNKALKIFQRVTFLNQALKYFNALLFWNQAFQISKSWFSFKFHLHSDLKIHYIWFFLTSWWLLYNKLPIICTPFIRKFLLFEKGCFPLYFLTRFRQKLHQLFKLQVVWSKIFILLEL